MPKVAKRRQINGCIRRGPKRKHASNTRSMHLSCEEVLYRQFLQKCMFVHGGAACSALLSIPTLIVWGAADQVFPMDNATRLQSDIENSKVAVIDGSGHLPQLEQTEAFLAAIRPFLKQTGSSQ